MARKIKLKTRIKRLLTPTTIKILIPLIALVLIGVGVGLLISVGAGLLAVGGLIWGDLTIEQLKR